MKRIIFFLAVFLPALQAAAQQRESHPERPNVIIINMDDMGYGDTEPYGATGYTTPNFNRLAREGMRFTHFYAAQAVCSPSRAALLTGCYPNRIGMSGGALMPWSRKALNPSEETIASLLKKAGYTTGMLGKWHLGASAPYLPLHYGFDSFYGLPYSNDMWPVDREGNLVTDTADFRSRFPPLPLIEGDRQIAAITTLEEQAALTTTLTRKAVQFIKKNRERPFFLYLAHPMPHIPLAVSDKFRGETAAGMFGDVISELDWSVGRVMDALEEEGLTNSTLFIVTSDNGPWLNFGNHAGSSGGLREGKGTAWDGGTRVPCFIRWPGKVAPGSICSQLLTNMDLLPTIMAAANAPLPKSKIDGLNFLPLLTGKEPETPRKVFYVYFNENSLKLIRYKQWELVLPHKSRTYTKALHGKDGKSGPRPLVSVPMALYDLTHDPGTVYDVQDQYPEIVKQILGYAREARDDLGDDLTGSEGKNIRKAATLLNAQDLTKPAIEALPGAKPRNIIFILSDDHRYDFMGFTGKVPGLQTPNIDRLAHEGAWFRNAFVTTALCSPSRASILTGQYAHTHTVVDNAAPAPPDLIYFPQYLQKAGYQTSFFGKWHMGGGSDDPRPGFTHWVSFKGQGRYYNPLLNIDGKHIQYRDSSYITDVLTDLALDWLEERDKNKPFFLYLSHKAVHSSFLPAKRDKGRYKDIQVQYPVSMFTTAGPESKTFSEGKRADGSRYEVNYRDIPQWVRAQRYSWHGVDFMYHGQTGFDAFYRDYLETLMGIDNSIGRVLDYLEKNDLDEETLVIYMGDNGFAFGEHGLIDKRTAYEESMRVPLLARCPSLIKPQTTIGQMVLNVDIAPSILEMAGVGKPSQMQGESFLPLLKDEAIAWRDTIFYEYYWEDAFPQTPTQYAVRTSQYKFIRSQGIWDIDQLYNIQKDPYEVNNLIRDPKYEETAKKLNAALWNWLERTGGLYIPLKPIRHKKNDHLYKGTW